ncbi:hypothetical protein CBR_g44915 [Chara braunii]|uniref:Uncharacterized protein n=1 Tax=Chara braunii TaxID=69332 RepID=A0A388LXX5_CHABU|nr:hypothetical protein CBR_g44915 [Chara braunii]|eukprot:GBG87180.1 hypothetical protein CBR_g44915 [Chara braunii]
MFRLCVVHDDHNIGEHFLMYYVITRPEPEQKEGTVALYSLGKIGTNRPGLLELIRIELLSIAQVMASEETHFQLRLRTPSAPRRMYHAVVVPDYLAQARERVVDFNDGKSLWPPSSYPKPVAPKTHRKAPKKRHRQPSPEAQGSRVGRGDEVVQRLHPVPTRSSDPIPQSKTTPIEGPPSGERVGTSRLWIRGSHPEPTPLPPLLPDINLDGAGSSAPEGGGGVGGVPYPASRPPILAGPFRFRQPPRGASVIDQ